MFKKMRNKLKQHIYKDYIHKSELLRPPRFDVRKMNTERLCGHYLVSEQMLSSLGAEKCGEIAKKQISVGIAEEVNKIIEINTQEHGFGMLHYGEIKVVNDYHG